MSHIPNSAMPHAGGTTEMEREGTTGTSMRERANSLMESARSHPKTTAAAGAAIVAGVAAAAATPFMLRRKNAGSKASSSSRSKAKKSS